jgi:hypothetical protein
MLNGDLNQYFILFIICINEINGEDWLMNNNIIMLRNWINRLIGIKEWIIRLWLGLELGLK